MQVVGRSISRVAHRLSDKLSRRACSTPHAGETGRAVHSKRNNTNLNIVFGLLPGNNERSYVAMVWAIHHGIPPETYRHVESTIQDEPRRQTDAPFRTHLPPLSPLQNPRYPSVEFPPSAHIMSSVIKSL